MTRPRRTRARESGLAPAAGARPAADRPLSDGSPSAVPPPGRPATEAADEPYVPVRWIRLVGWPILGALAGLAGLLLAGVPLWRSVVIAVTGGVVLYLVVRSMAAEPPEWPYDAVLEPHRPFTAWELPGLESSREKGPSFQRFLRPRLWELCQELLRRRGLDPSSAEAAALLGAEAYRLLAGEDPTATPDSGTISRLCLAVARLAIDPIPGTPTPIRDPALAGLTGHPTRRSDPSPRKDTP